MTSQSLKVLLSGMALLAISPGTASTQPNNLAKGQSATRSSTAICVPAEHMSVEQFGRLMDTVRKAWLNGDAESALTCFSSSAIFSVPPTPGVIGKESIYKIFTSGQHHELLQRVDWHRLIFDPAQQTGAVEFTIERRIPTHGVIIVKISHGLISNWREYAIASDLSWEKFQGMNEF